MKGKRDYRALDRPEILRVLFYPRPDWSMSLNHRLAMSLMIPVAERVEVQAQAYISAQDAPNIIFFHGNGEIASDYQEMAPFFTDRGINLIVCEYRGYGCSGGVPTVSDMMADSLTIFDYLKRWFHENSFSGMIIIMGRSLGSASALEIADNHPGGIDGLIIESGFAYITPLLQLLGVDLAALKISEEQGIGNLSKIRNIDTPTLIIHAQYDHIIAYKEGEALFAASAAKAKKMLRIAGANHNNIFIAGMTDYMTAIAWLIETAARIKPER